MWKSYQLLNYSGHGWTSLRFFPKSLTGKNSQKIRLTNIVMFYIRYSKSNRHLRKSESALAPGNDVIVTSCFDSDDFWKSVSRKLFKTCWKAKCEMSSSSTILAKMSCVSGLWHQSRVSAKPIGIAGRGRKLTWLSPCPTFNIQAALATFATFWSIWALAPHDYLGIFVLMGRRFCC